MDQQPDQQHQHSINPVQFGIMLAQLTQLNATLQRLEPRVETLETVYRGVNERFRVGKAGVVCFILGIGCALFGAKELIKVVWDLVFPGK